MATYYSISPSKCELSPSESRTRLTQFLWRHTNFSILLTYKESAFTKARISKRSLQFHPNARLLVARVLDHLNNLTTKHLFVSELPVTETSFYRMVGSDVRLTFTPRGVVIKVFHHVRDMQLIRDVTLPIQPTRVARVLPEHIPFNVLMESKRKRNTYLIIKDLILKSTCSITHPEYYELELETPDSTALCPQRVIGNLRIVGEVRTMQVARSDYVLERFFARVGLESNLTTTVRQVRSTLRRRD